jgi:taurine dioxygenase
MGAVVELHRYLDLFPPPGPRILRRLPPGLESRPYERFAVRPLGSVLGAEIGGVDLRRPLGDAVTEDLRRALREWKVLVFRGGEADIQNFCDLACCFGETLDDTVLGRTELHVRPNVMVRDSRPEQNYWHADATFRADPPRATVLRIKPPSTGGDTLFCDMGAAYDNLPEPVQAAIAGLTAVHDVSSYADSFHHQRTVAESKWPPVEHPVVLEHPETGRKAIYVNAQWTRAIVGLDPEEGRTLLLYLCAQASVPEYQFRLNWHPHAIAVWDNWAVQHYALGDYTQPRSMWRTTIRGQRL